MQKKTDKIKKEELSIPEEEYSELKKPNYEYFDDYLELVI